MSVSQLTDSNFPHVPIGPEAASQLCSAYWQALHAIDRRFPLEGASHSSERAFLPFASLVDRWSEIQELIGKTTQQIREVSAEGERME